MDGKLKLFVVCCLLAVVLSGVILIPKLQPAKDTRESKFEKSNLDLVEDFCVVLSYNEKVLQKIITATGSRGIKATEMLAAEEAPYESLSRAVYYELLEPYFSPSDYDANFSARFYFFTTVLLNLKESDFVNKAWYEEYKEIYHAVCKDDNMLKADIHKARVAWEKMIYGGINDPTPIVPLAKTVDGVPISAEPGQPWDGPKD